MLKISKSIKLLVKMKNVSFILQEKLKGLFGQPSRENNSYILNVYNVTAIGETLCVHFNLHSSAK